MKNTEGHFHLSPPLVLHAVTESLVEILTTAAESPEVLIKSVH
uniref:Uncharacterized protein n=1 Tax=Anguilla anguilla TaxID=7936 RepID=A0A0E9TA72_ANGAN